MGHQAGDDIYLAVERGLQAARVQVLCLSPEAVDSDWVSLERSTVLFRDPSNAGRRFVPLLLVACDLPDSLRRYKYVDFRDDSAAGFEELLAALKPDEPVPATVPVSMLADSDEVSDLDGGQSEIRDVGLDPSRLRCVRVIHDTVQSKVAILASDDSEFILKRTPDDICQFNTLRKLVQRGEIVGDHGLKVRLAVPITIWRAGGSVYELSHFYKGITLNELVLRNRFRITGEFLARFHNSFVSVLFDLHKLGIVHRDLQPRNILLTEACRDRSSDAAFRSDNEGPDVVVLDSTLACRIGSSQVPIDSVYYTAPEQLQGAATCASDLYSLGAIEFFMANGFAPGTCSPSKLNSAFQRIGYGSWYSNWEPTSSSTIEYQESGGGWLVAGLLLREENLRPSKAWELILETQSRCCTTVAADVRSILDGGDIGYLACGATTYKLVQPDEWTAFLAEALLHTEDRDESLFDAMKSHLAGDAP